MATSRHIASGKRGTNDWSVGVCESCCAQPTTCILGCILPCVPLYNHRMVLLNQDIMKYQCCQGYHGCAKCDCRSCTDPCPSFCLCLETCMCTGPSVITNRIMLEERFSLKLDPCDYAIFAVSCLFSVLGAICQNDGCKTIGDLLWCLGIGLFNAQHANEIKVRGLDVPGGAPDQQSFFGAGPTAPYHAAGAGHYQSAPAPQGKASMY